ncbi:MAG: hypothetical protein KGJ13_03445 [Patescibacteria group bacterium]|nr:hypothetical protein [Patescibacteria group bacterium]
MATILRIKYTDFLFKRDSDAARVLSLLASACQMDRDWYANKDIYFPSEEPGELTMSVIQPHQIKAFNPREEMKHKGPLELNPPKP